MIIPTCLPDLSLVLTLALSLHIVFVCLFIFFACVLPVVCFAVFFFSLMLNMLYLSRGIVIYYSLGRWWWGVGEEKAMSSSMMKSQSFNKSDSLDCELEECFPFTSSSSLNYSSSIHCYSYHGTIVSLGSETSRQNRNNQSGKAIWPWFLWVQAGGN